MGDKIVSVLTLVSGRYNAFLNLIKGLDRSTRKPDELIVVFMNQEPFPIPALSFEVKSFHLHDTSNLPLSAARNKAAQEATGDLLIFLDVDCIPDINLISSYALADDLDSLLVGSVRYLKNKADEEEDFLNRLVQLSVPDPIRSGVHPLPYELFWSLNFACTKQIYELIGGFDQHFKGYGGEDTDFGFMAREKQIKIQTVSAVAFHQHHNSYSPPLNHFQDIVVNAERFYLKWKIWAMEGWLKDFERMGLIFRVADKVQIIRLPSQKEIEQALKR